MNVGVAFSNVGAADGAFTLDDKFFGGAAAEGDQIITLDADAAVLPTGAATVSKSFTLIWLLPSTV